MTVLDRFDGETSACPSATLPLPCGLIGEVADGTFPVRTEWGPGASAQTLGAGPRFSAIEILWVPAAENPAEGASAVGTLVPRAERSRAA